MMMLINIIKLWVFKYVLNLSQQRIKLAHKVIAQGTNSVAQRIIYGDLMNNALVNRRDDIDSNLERWTS